MGSMCRKSLPSLCLLGFATATLLGACGESEPPATQAEKRPPALVAVAEQGDISALNRLLTARTDPDVRDACQWTPLMKAALNGHLDLVERLVEAEATIDAEDTGGYTAMMLAASNNHAKVVDYLLAQGAEIDHQETTQGYTALIWAAKLGHNATVEVLLDHGADIAVREHSGLNAAQIASRHGHQAITERLSAADDSGTAASS